MFNRIKKMLQNPLNQPQVEGYESFVPQQYEEADYADRLIPAGVVHPMIYQAMYASPYVGPMRGNAIPIMYTKIKADAVPRGPIGMVTPSVTPAGQMITAQGETTRKAL